MPPQLAKHRSAARRRRKFFFRESLHLERSNNFIRIQCPRIKENRIGPTGEIRSRYLLSLSSKQATFTCLEGHTPKSLLQRSAERSGSACCLDGGLPIGPYHGRSSAIISEVELLRKSSCCAAVAGPHRSRTKYAGRIAIEQEKAIR